MPEYGRTVGRRPLGGRRFAAVDFDGRQLRIAHAERAGDQTRILKLAAIATPEGLEQDPKAFGEMLGRTLKDMRAGSVGILMAVPRGQAVLKPVILPSGTPQAELANMVQFQVDKELPFRAEEAVFDFTVESHYSSEQPAGQPTASGIDVLVGAVRLPVVDHYRRIAEAAGVELVRLGLRPYANLRCVDACTRRAAEETVLVVHLAADETEIDVLVGKSLAFSRSASVKVPPFGADRHELAQFAKSVAKEVGRSVQSYQAVERSTRIHGALVAGGMGVEALVAEELLGQLGVPCELFNPSTALGLGQVENASAFITALGLALGHRGPEELPLDFINPKRPRVKRNVRRIAAIVAAAMVLLAVIAGVAAGAIVMSGKQKVLDKLSQDRDALQQQAKTLEGIKKRIARIKEWNDQGRDWIVHWAYLSALFPSCTDAYLTNFKTGADEAITFTVHARDSKLITDLGIRLTEAGYKFKLGRLAASTDPYGYPYMADVRVIVEPDVNVDLTSVRAIPRPADDASAEVLARIATRGEARSEGRGEGQPEGRGEGRPGGRGEGRFERPGGPPGGGPSPAGGPGGGPPGPGGGPSASPLMDEATYTARRDALMQEILQKFDEDHDGRIDRGESRKYASQIYALVRTGFDLDKNGESSTEERKLRERFLAEYYKTTGSSPPGR